MKLKELFDKAGLSRRGLLQGMGTVVAVAAASGCSKNDGTLFEEFPQTSLVPAENLVMDKTMKMYYSSGAYNCGARCVHKVFVKNGRIVKFTSCGDTMRAGSQASDESVGDNGISIQRRACVRGYSYIQRLYQPDKLKYPLMQFGTRGDVNGFKRVSWEKALNAAADAIAKAVARKEQLGYSPIMIKWIKTLTQYDYFSDPKVAPCIHFLGNESTGAVDACKFDAVGVDAITNNVADRLNSKFIITWGLDPSRTTYHVANSFWFNTKAKEKGIPIVSITTNYNDSAAMIATGIKGYTYTRADGSSKVVDIPAWIPCRPATDGALAVAMAYVIYKNGLCDDEYVKLGSSKSFGFAAGDVCVSTAPCAIDPTTGAKVVNPVTNNFVPTVSQHTFGHSKNMKSPADFQDADGRQFRKGDAYTGAKFAVPTGQSFSEYLDARETEWSIGTIAGGAAVGDDVYFGVLDYVERLTGVHADIIEALAHKYATTKPSFLDVGGGPQRAWNGFEWVWLMIALTTMTGNVDKPGGGAGFSMMSHSDIGAIGLNPALTGGLEMGLMGASGMLGDAQTMNAIYIPMNSWAHVVLTGKDHRSRERFIEDVKITTATAADGKTPKAPLDLSAVPTNKKLLEIDVWFITENNIVTTAENINKNIEAVKSIPTVICLDQVMSPTALYATIVLPAASHYEKDTVTIQVGSSVLFAMQKAIDKLYDTKTDNEIKFALTDKLNERVGSTWANTSYVDKPMSEASIIAFAPSKQYKAATGNTDAKFSYTDLLQNGFTEVIIPPDKPLVGFRDFAHSTPGRLENTTGKINFWSPLWGKIREKTTHAVTSRDAAGNIRISTTDGIRTARPSYQANIEGYDKYFANNDPREAFTGYISPLSGRTYNLYYMTNKARNRAHTVLDNVGMIRSEFEQNVKINPVDAAYRGITNGDIVYAYNDRGCTKLPAHVTQQIPPGIISIEHGAWYRAHPTETVKVWIQDNIAEDFHERHVPVDVGGAENVLTLDLGSTEQYVGQATSAQGGPCEVSLVKPE